MQYIARSVPPPSILTGSVAKLYREGAARFMRQSNEVLSQHALMRSSLNLAHESMVKALDKLFDGRCAFCEAEVPTQAYRLRPFENALPYQASEHAHLYYLWMDVAWQNLYSICSSCLPENAEYFPVFGKRAPLPSLRHFEEYAADNTGLWPEYPLKERPVLLDPCLDKELHLEIGVQGDGRLVGIGQRGVVTIEHFSLNADQRIAQRAEAFRYYFEDLLNCTLHPELDIPPPFPGRPDMQFGGSWYLLLRRLAISVAAQTGHRPILSRSRIGGAFNRLRGDPEAEKLLRACWSRTSTETIAPFSGPLIHAPREQEPTVVRVNIENFKSLEHLELTLPPARPALSPQDKPRTPALLVLGENAAGKSSILEAIALGISTGPAIRELNLRREDLILDPVLLGGKKRRAKLAARVEIGMSDQSTHELTITPDGFHRTPQHHRSHIPVFAYGAFRQYQKSGDSHSRTYVHNLFDGGILPNPEKWLRSLAVDRYAMVIRALAHILTIDEKFEVIRWDEVREQYFVVTAVENKKVLARTSLSAASSGFRSVLAMVCDVMRGMMDKAIMPHFETLETASAVVLIDEVEAHLHPRWKMQIMQGLRKALPKVTFIATSHDPLCLRGMDDGETRVLRRIRLKPPGTAAGLPAYTEVATELPPASEMSVEQLLTSDLFQLHSTDDPQMEKRFAEIADLLALEQRSEEEQYVVDRFEEDVISALPIGTSEAHRLVQEAVAEYLKKRQDEPEAKRKESRERVKRSIAEALRSIL